LAGQRPAFPERHTLSAIQRLKNSD